MPDAQGPLTLLHQGLTRKDTPYVPNCTTHHSQVYTWLDRVNRKCHGAYSARSISLVNLRSTMSLRRSYGRDCHVVRHLARAVALFRNGPLVCRVVETLSRRRFVLLLRRAGFPFQSESLQICSNREVRRRLGQPSLLLGLSRRDGHRHRPPGRVSCRTAFAIGLQFRGTQPASDDPVLARVPIFSRI